MKTAAALLLFALIGAPQDTLRSDVNVVSVYFTVHDGKGRLVTDLEKDAFKVFEDRREQTISFFGRHTDVPITVGVLLDTSTSLPRTLGLEAEAAGHFFNMVMRPNDVGFLISYASRFEVLQVPTEDARSLADKAQTIRRYARTSDLAATPQRASPQTPSQFPFPTPSATPTNLRVARLYDAIGSSVDRFLAREVGRKALVIAALADDARSESSLKDALQTLKQNDVIAYVLEVEHAQRGPEHDDCDIRHIFRNDAGSRIARLAEETGGRVIKVEGFDKMRAAFEQIADELHHQYSLGYRPANQNWDGSFRKLVIDAGKGYKVNARDGYYAKPRN